MTVKEATYILKNAAWLGTDEDREATEAAVQMAVAALEKQEAKKPIRINRNAIFDGNWKVICPNCGKVLMERITTEDISYPRRYNLTGYCRCGQKIDWMEGE